MQIDKVTFNDLSIFQHEEEFSLFHKLNFTQTSVGKEWLIRFFSEPFNNLKKITETQQIIRLIATLGSPLPQHITNGTIMVMERFYETAIDTIPDSPNLPNAYSYKLLHNPDYSLVKYSVGHFADFIRGCRQITELFDINETPPSLQFYISRIKDLIKSRVMQKLGETNRGDALDARQVIYFGNYLRYHFKTEMNELIHIFGRLDAWYAMAAAVEKYHLCFPDFIESPHPHIEADRLYHILLPAPVSYDIRMNEHNNFIFLTGANMAGKSTFIKAIGASVYLAHIGMGVPAESMQLTMFNGILSNINVADNIVKGESYFFNEVQRIKNTILKINDGKKWLVLIDELFKGTNVQDAMKCSSTVIKGLIKISNSLFILSTHLYEIGEELKQYPTISFRYFETMVKEDQLEFNYQLKEGISNDRLGYLILKREKVVEMLENL
ncbi:MAG: DNA mismatch repair protein MutS [Chitinophagaceae bacterium]|nr:DNA mismatch repair protein MutS [Chitinophagaceae bacterium]